MSDELFELLEQQDWRKVSARLTAFAHRRLGSRGTLADAEELAQEAIRLFFDGGYRRWSPQEEKVILRLGSIVNGLIQNRGRKAETRLADSHDFATTNALGGAAVDGVTPERLCATAETGTQALDQLFDHLDGNERAQKVLLLELDGVSDVGAQADQLGLDRKAIYKARERLAEARKAVRPLFQGEV